MTTKPYVRYLYKLIFGSDGATWARTKSKAEYDRLIQEDWESSTKADMDWDCERRYGQFCGHHQPMYTEAADIIAEHDHWDEQTRIYATG